MFLFTSTIRSNRSRQILWFFLLCFATWQTIGHKFFVLQHLYLYFCTSFFQWSAENARTRSTVFYLSLSNSIPAGVKRSIPAGMEWTISFWPEWNGPFHSGWNGMTHFILAGMNCSIPAGMKWTISFRPEWNEPFHSGRNEMSIPWTQIRNMPQGVT